MAYQNITGSATTQIFTADDMLYVMAAGEVSNVASGHALQFVDSLNTLVLLDGEVTSGNGYGVHLSPGSVNTNLRVGATGRATGRDAGVKLAGEEQLLVNRGLLKATGASLGYGVIAEGNGETVINRGTIKGGASGWGQGVAFFNAWDNLLVNSGRVSADVGVAFRDCDDGEIDNSGRIAGSTIGVYLQTGTWGAEIHNTGVIVGGTTGIESHATVAQIVNDGTLRTRDTATGHALLGDVGREEVINGGEIIGTVDLGGGNDTFAAQGMGRVEGLVRGGAGDDILAGAGADDHLLGDSGADILRGGGGNDWLEGGEHNDDLRGGDGDDRLEGGTGSDDLLGDAGNDRLDGGDDGDLLEGGGGDDLLIGGGGHDALRGEAGNDVLRGDAGVDTMQGGDGGDTLLGGADGDLMLGDAGRDTLRGQLGDDQLQGGAGGDWLYGGGGADLLYGDWGNDRLSGGTGVDTFRFDAPFADFGTDRILDWEDGTDRLALTGFGPLDIAAFLAAAMTEANGNAVIDLAAAGAPGTYSGTIVILGAAGLIDPGDFV